MSLDGARSPGGGHPIGSRSLGHEHSMSLDGSRLLRHDRPMSLDGARSPGGGHPIGSRSLGHEHSMSLDGSRSRSQDRSVPLAGSFRNGSMWLAAVAALCACAGCGATKPTSPSEPIAERQRARPALDVAAIRGLPMSIIGLQALPISMGARTDRLLGAASYNVPCTDAIAQKLTGYYWPLFDDTIDIAISQLVTGTMTIDEIAACLQAMEGGNRLPSSAPDLVALDTDRALLALPSGGILVARTADDLRAVASAKHAASHPVGHVEQAPDHAGASLGDPAPDHPLVRLVAPAPSSAEWTALAVDYTWELLGVESLGVVLEYDQALESGPLAIRVRFRDADAAKLARERFDHPDDVVGRSVLGEAVADALAVIRTRGTIALEGRDVVIRGRIQESEWAESPLAIFRGLAVPVGRPLTDEERRRLLRRR